MGWTGHPDRRLAPQQVWHRAGRRRQHNAIRRLCAALRQGKVYALWQQHLSQRQMAHRLAVSPTTIARDVAAIRLGLRLVAQQRIVAETVGEMLLHVPPRRQWDSVGDVPQRDEKERNMTTPRLSVRVAPDLLAQLTAKATLADLSLSEAVREALTRYCQAGEAAPPRPSGPAHAPTTPRPWVETLPTRVQRLW